LRLGAIQARDSLAQALNDGQSEPQKRIPESLNVLEAIIARLDRAIQ
jgi:hypothetical protein